MRLSASSPTLFSLLAIVLTSSHPTQAKPYPRTELVIEAQNTTLAKRECSNPCGWTGQLCCGASESCYTDSAGQAQCGAGTSSSSGGSPQANNANGQWQWFTTTYVETDLVTRTSTYSSFCATSPTVQQGSFATGARTCNTQLSETPCGSICCAMGQYCQYQGQCAAAAGGGGDVSSFYYSSVTATGNSFVRPTSNTVQTVTSTGSATTTIPFGTASPTVGGATAGMQATTSNNGLSGGAIAGIVIGVIAGVILLLIICGLCCFKGLIDGVLGFFGLGPRRRRREREETYIEERHSHHGGGGGGRWWGTTRPSRIERPQRRNDGGFGGFGAVAAGLTALAVLLGLKRRRDRRDKESYGTGSMYTYSDYTSASKCFSFLQINAPALT
ncbi:MAG: hypothetical protein LQ342_001644 [Letrouitia transgressa]|nr:MAG: hypothetical protein LQ342_001644 [Letrouitia transgressa]